MSADRSSATRSPRTSGTADSSSTSREKMQADGHERWTLVEVAALALIVLIGGVLRLYRIGELPPGLHQDEAIYGLYSLDVSLGHFRMFFGEREPLYMYLVAPMSYLVGVGPLALRLTSALVGTLAVLTTYLAARSLFGRAAALFAGATLATALWPVMISRIGFRAGTLPLLESAALWLLWEGWRHRAPGRSLLGGALVGLTMYTYIAARFFPVVLVAFVPLGLAFCRGWILARARCIALAAVAAAASFAPLGYYFVRHPEAFFGRPAQVAAVSGGEAGAAGLSGTLSDLPANALRVAGMFFTAGDANWRHNLSGEPAVILPVALAMLLGLALAIAAPRRPANLLVVLLLPVMLVPSALSIDAPHYLRTLGAAPAAALAVGLGLAWLSRFGRQRLSSRTARRAVLPALFALCLVPGITTWRDYFVIWANRPEAHSAYNVAYAAVGQYLAESDLWRSGAGRVYVSREFYEDRASLTYFLWPYLTDAERSDWTLADRRVTWFDEEHALPLPAAGPALYIAGPDIDRARLDSLGIANETHPVSPDGRTGFVSGRLPADWRADRAAPGRPLAASGAAGLDLIGYSLAKTGAGESTLSLFWRASGTPPTVTPSAFVHLLDDGGATLTGNDREIGVAASEWRDGDELVTTHRLTLPPGTPGGEYAAEVGLYDRATLQRQTLRVGGKADSRVVLDQLSFDERRATRADVQPETILDKALVPEIRLVGFDGAGNGVATAAPGARLPVVLYWEALAQPGDYAVETGLLDAAGHETSATRAGLNSGRNSSSRWSAGEVVRESAEARIAPTTPPGQFRLFVRLVDSSDARSTRAEIGAVTVAGPPRSFAPPTPSEGSGAQFGEFARLVGYDIAAGPVRPGDRVRLRLYWLAIAETKTDYKVFTHLLDEQEQVRGQLDSVPAAGSRPTTGWVPGEYVVDDYELTVAADATGQLRVEVGLYDAATGGRLPVLGASGAGASDRFVLRPALSVQR